MKKAKYFLTLNEAIDVLQIISAHKKVDASNLTGSDKQECIQLFDTLIETILLGDKKDGMLTYEADNKVAFSIWSAVDIYKAYLTESGCTDELTKVNALMDKLRCKA